MVRAREEATGAGNIIIASDTEPQNSSSTLNDQQQKDINRDIERRGVAIEGEMWE